MNENYALDPALGNISSRDLRAFLRMFGLDQGRFLAKYPEDWPRRLMNELGALPDVEKSKIQSLMAEIEREKKFVFRALPQVPYDEALEWGGNIQKILNRNELLREVFGRPGNERRWRTVSDLLEGVGQDLPDGRGAHVGMNINVYADCVAPLLAVSGEVTMVDPYFYLNPGCDQQRTELLEMLVDRASKTPTYRILVICDEELISKKSEGETGDLQANLQNKWDRRVGRKKVQVSFLLKQKREIGHGRYIFSCYGGLQFDQGFGVLPGKGRTNHVHWLCRAELVPLLDRFQSTRC